MVASDQAKQPSEIEEDNGAATVSSYSDQAAFDVSTSRRELLGKKIGRSKFKNMVKNLHSSFKFTKFQSSMRSSSSEERRGYTSSIPTTNRRTHKKSVFKKINWGSLWELFKKWIKKPMNIALFIWIAVVTISGAILFLVMTGMLNAAIPSKAQRDTWFEVNNQILNALFTLMCLYQHPKRFHQLALLHRWNQNDIQNLRNEYSKNGTQKPNERKHILVVLLFLHLNCFATYALCGLNLGYRRSQRPVLGVALCLSVAIASPAIASVYNMLSPLGKEYDDEVDGEMGSETSTPLSKKPLEKRYSFVAREDRRMPENTPQWVGGLFDFWDDISLAYLSVFCSCCLFGWNMDRLGFGNMYVHIATFLLFCLAPFFIFNLAAVNIDNEAVREALGITGFLLCIFGLLYGGFWRIRMRQKFNLPANELCCHNPSVTDCIQWLCCCSCALAQEVRTADYYDIEEDRFYIREMSDSGQFGLSPLAREARTPQSSSPSFIQIQKSTSPTRFSEGFASDRNLTTIIQEDSFDVRKADALSTPVFSVMQRDDNQLP